MALTDKLTSIADAIRGKTGKTDEMTLDQMPAEIASIETGGGGDDGFALLTKEIETVPNSWKDVTAIPDFAFYKCTKLKEIDFPNALSVGEKAFATVRNSGMSYDRINLPRVVTVGANAFNTYGDTPFDAYLPNATTFGSQVFAHAWNLRFVIVPKMDSVTHQCFYDMADATLVLPQSFVVTLGTTSWFNVKQIYVPANMFEQYKNATNWSAIADKIFAIEDSEEVLAKLAEVGYEYVPTTAGGVG